METTGIMAGGLCLPCLGSSIPMSGLVLGNVLSKHIAAERVGCRAPEKCWGLRTLNPKT